MALPGILDPWADIIHPAALILPRATASDYAELKTSIEAKGMLTPLAIYIDKGGDQWLLDGVGRLQVLVELDHRVLDDNNEWAVPHVDYLEEQGADPYEIALSLNLARRHLTNDQKRQVVRDLREQRPELSDRAVARMAGVSAPTVAAVREAQETEPANEDAATEEVSEAIGEPEAADAAEPAVEAREPEPEPERREEGGRRARGRRPGTTPPAPAAPPNVEPFAGKTLPTAPKAARVAEVRRCMRYLKVTVDDLQPRN